LTFLQLLTSRVLLLDLLSRSLPENKWQLGSWRNHWDKKELSYWQMFLCCQLSNGVGRDGNAEMSPIRWLNFVDYKWRTGSAKATSTAMKIVITVNLLYPWCLVSIYLLRDQSTKRATFVRALVAYFGTACACTSMQSVLTVDRQQTKFNKYLMPAIVFGQDLVWYIYTKLKSLVMYLCLFLCFSRDKQAVFSILVAG
jgi:hypothetical protein